VSPVGLSSARLDEKTFAFISEWIREQSAMELEVGKEYLVESRLRPVLDEFELDGFKALVTALQIRSNRKLAAEVVEAMTVNESSFFRDDHPFVALRDVIIPQLLENSRPGQPLTIWCGASSSGQEPVSILLVIAEHFPQLLAPGRLKLVCSDISPQMVLRTKEATYSRVEVGRGLPPQLLGKYFKETDRQWQLVDSLRRHLVVHQMNLVGPWMRVPQADLVMMRNVLIYFAPEAKKQIIEKIQAQVLLPGGALFLGASEAARDMTDGLELERHGRTVVYRSRAAE